MAKGRRTSCCMWFHGRLMRLRLWHSESPTMWPPKPRYRSQRTYHAHHRFADFEGSNASNGKGVNARENIIFVRSALEKGGARRASWELKIKELRRYGTLTEQPKYAYDLLLRDLRSVMPETPLERILRKMLEFDALEQGRAGHVEF